MKELMEALERVFENYIGDLTYFLIDNEEVISVLDIALTRGYPVRHEMESLQELYDNLNNHIAFMSNHTEEIGYYTI